MGRVSCLVALLVAALLVADAYAHRTTITTVKLDEDNQWPFGRDRCRHIKPHEQLRNCESFLRQGGRGEEVLQIKGMGNQWPRPWGHREKGSEECCRELINMDALCMCDALGQVAREVQQQSQGAEVMERARDLPLNCGIFPPRCGI